jgi:hypothetical protein
VVDTTPGPWISSVVSLGRSHQIQVRSETGTIAHVIVPRCIKGKLHTDVASANGKLMAMAPQMRDALIQAIERAEDQELPPESFLEEWRRILKLTGVKEVLP